MFTGRQILKNTLLLTAAALLLRLLSMLFQAYLAGRIGAEGLGGVQLVLSVSAFAATLGLAGHGSRRAAFAPRPTAGVTAPDCRARRRTASAMCC